MLARVGIPGTWMWSEWQPGRGMPFNSYAFERDGGCVLVDPLPLDGSSADALAAMGGAATIVLTNRDHERHAASARERFDARILAHSREAPLFGVTIDGTFEDGDEVFPGAFALALSGGKTDGEIALHFPSDCTALVGDALIGSPAGAVSLLPDEKLENARGLLFALRGLWSLQLQTLLLCDGQPIFGDADRVIGELLRSRLGAEALRVNADELTFVPYAGPGPYACDDGEVGLPIGARKLGYRVARLQPGKAFCPLHWHVASEEFFYVLEGTPSVRMGSETLQCRPGDFIAFPCGESGAHQLRNDSDEPCLVLMVGIEDQALDLEACFYPDSDKLGVWSPTARLRMVRASPDLDYYDGE